MRLRQRLEEYPGWPYFLIVSKLKLEDWKWDSCRSILHTLPHSPCSYAFFYCQKNQWEKTPSSTSMYYSNTMEVLYRVIYLGSAGGFRSEQIYFRAYYIPYYPCRYAFFYFSEKSMRKNPPPPEHDIPRFGVSMYYSITMKVLYQLIYLASAGGFRSEQNYFWAWLLRLAYRSGALSSPHSLRIPSHKSRIRASTRLLLNVP